MPKDNFIAPLDNLLRRYRRDRQWLSILCRLDYKVFNKDLQNDQTTYGQLQEMLARGGIDLKITVPGEDPVPENSARLQFLINTLKSRKTKADIIFGTTNVTNAPYCWFQRDDIELIYLSKLEKYFGEPFNWTFSGIYKTPDIMKSTVLKTGEDFRLLPPETAERFRQNAMEMYPEGIPNELLTQAVLKDIPKAKDYYNKMKQQTTTPSASTKEPDKHAEAPVSAGAAETAAGQAAPVPETRETPVPEKKKTDNDKYAAMNENAISEIIDKTGFDRELAGGIVFPGLIKEALADADRTAFENKDREIRETLMLLKQSHKWLFTLLEKKNHKDRDIFTMTKYDFTEAYREFKQEKEKDTSNFASFRIGFLCAALADYGLDFTLRFVSDPRPGAAYAKYKSGFFRRWYEKNKPGNINKEVVEDMYNKDDFNVTDKFLQSISDFTKEPVVIYMHRKGTTNFAAEDSFTFYPKKEDKVEPAPAASDKKEEKPKPDEKPARKTQPKPAVPAKPSVAEWLSKQERFDALKDRLGAGAAILDGRYGEDTVDACFPYSGPDDIPFALMSLNLKKAIRSAEIAADAVKEPDFDTRMLISSNRTVTDCIECMDRILENLRMAPGHETIILSEPMTTTIGTKATAVTRNADGGLDVTVEQKGFLGKKSVTCSGGAEGQYLLFGLFTKEQWYRIAKTAKENYRKYSAERYASRIREAAETQKRAVEAVERAIAEIRAAIVSLIKEADGTGLFDDFAVMSGDCLFDNPSFQDGHARFICTQPQGESHLDETEIPVGSLREINEHLIEHLKKKLDLDIK